MSTGTIKVYERTYTLTGVFAESNVKEANAFMLENPDMGVIAVRNGWIYIVRLNDKGVVLEDATA